MIRWETPRPAERGPTSRVWIKRLEPLMEKPGEWAVVWEGKNQKRTGATVAKLKRGILNTPPGLWEFTSRAADDGTGLVYARYLGPEDEDAA